MTLTCHWAQDHPGTGKLVMTWTSDDVSVMTPETRNRTRKSTPA